MSNYPIPMPITWQKVDLLYCPFDLSYTDKISGNTKELIIIPDAVHTDLYDKTDIIPFDKLDTFFRENLK